METSNLELAYEKLTTKLHGWFLTIVEMLPNFVIALLVIILFHIASKWLSKLGERALGKVSKNLTINKLIARAFGLTLLLAGIFFALGLLHLDKTVTSLLAGIGIIGLAFSFAFQHTAANILSGFIISIRSSVNVGDLIRSNDHFGNVLRVGLRTIKILNVKGQHVELPNRLFLDNPMLEFSQTGYRRIDLKGKINFNEDLNLIRETAEEAMMEFDFIEESKMPNFVYNELHKEKIDFTLRVWMKFTNKDGEFLNARSQCLVRLSEVFNDLGVAIARDEVIYLNHNPISKTGNK